MKNFISMSQQKQLDFINANLEGPTEQEFNAFVKKYAEHYEEAEGALFAECRFLDCQVQLVCRDNADGSGYEMDADVYYPPYEDFVGTTVGLPYDCVPEQIFAGELGYSEFKEMLVLNLAKLCRHELFLEDYKTRQRLKEELGKTITEEKFAALAKTHPADGATLIDVPFGKKTLFVWEAQDPRNKECHIPVLTMFPSVHRADYPLNAGWDVLGQLREGKLTRDLFLTTLAGQIVTYMDADLLLDATKEQEPVEKFFEQLNEQIEETLAKVDEPHAQEEALAQYFRAGLPEKYFDDFIAAVAKGEERVIFEQSFGEYGFSLDLTDGALVASLRAKADPAYPLWDMQVGGMDYCDDIKDDLVTYKSFLRKLAHELAVCGHLDSLLEAVKENEQAVVPDSIPECPQKQSFTLELDSTELQCIKDMLKEEMNYWLCECQDPNDYKGHVRAGISLLNGLGEEKLAKEYKQAAVKAFSPSRRKSLDNQI